MTESVAKRFNTEDTGSSEKKIQMLQQQRRLFGATKYDFDDA